MSSSYAVTPERPGNAAEQQQQFSATPPSTRSPQQKAMTPEGAPPSGALDELRRKMLYRHKQQAGGGGSIQHQSPSGSGSVGDIHPHPPPGSSPSSTPLGTTGAAVESPEEQRPKDDAEEMRTALFQGRALPIRVVQGGDLRSDQDEASTDPHKLFQLLRKKKRATPSTSSKPFVPYQPPVVDNRSSNTSNQSPEVSPSVGGGSTSTSSNNNNNSPLPPNAATGEVVGPDGMVMHTTPPRPQGTIPSRRPTNGRRASGDLTSSSAIAPRPTQQSVSAPAGSSGDVIPPTSLADAGGAPSSSSEAPPAGGGGGERPSSRIGSAAAKKREIQSAGLHGRPCTRQKHPKKALDLFDSSNAKKDEELFPKRRSSAPLGVVGSAGTPKAGGAGGGGVAPLQASALVNSANPHGVTTVPSPNKPVTSSTTTGAGQVTATTSENGRKSETSPGTQQAEQDVNFDCLFIREDEFGGEADAFPTAPKAKQANIPLIETDWFTTDSWEPLPCSDGHEVLECDTEDYAESLYELLKASTMRKSSFRK